MLCLHGFYIRQYFISVRVRASIKEVNTLLMRFEIQAYGTWGAYPIYMYGIAARQRRSAWAMSVSDTMLVVWWQVNDESEVLTGIPSVRSASKSVARPNW